MRKVVRHSHLMVQIEDILYWLAVSLLMFYFMLHRNYGEIRFFSIAGAAVGAVLYFCSLSQVVTKISIAIITFVQKVLFTVARILLTPLRFFLKLLTPPVKWMMRRMHRKMRYVKRGTATKVKGIYRNIFVMLKKV